MAEYDVGLNIVEEGSTYITLYALGSKINGKELFPFPWTLTFDGGTSIATLQSYGEYTIRNLQPNTNYTFCLYASDGTRFGYISGTTSSGGGITPDPDPGGGGTTVTQSWQLYANYTITETTVTGFIQNLSSSAFYLNTVTLRNAMGIVITMVNVNVLVAASNYCPFSISNLSLTPALYYIYVNNDYYAGSVVLSSSSSSTKPQTFSWQTSVILQGYPLKITASDWTLLQNKITEVYIYIKSTNRPTWTAVIKGITPISAATYNEVASAINGLWYGNTSNYVAYASQKETKLTADIFNNLSTQLNKYINTLT